MMHQSAENSAIQRLKFEFWKYVTNCKILIELLLPPNILFSFFLSHVSTLTVQHNISVAFGRVLRKDKFCAFVLFLISDCVLLDGTMTETSIPMGHHTTQQNYLIQFNMEYFKTRDGILKVVQLVRNVSDVLLFVQRMKVARAEDFVAFSWVFLFHTYTPDPHTVIAKNVDKWTFADRISTGCEVSLSAVQANEKKKLFSFVLEVVT